MCEENLPIINMPIDKLQHLLVESLLDIKNKTIRDNESRICINLINILKSKIPDGNRNLLRFLSLNFVETFCQSWEYYSGSPNYPVPSDHMFNDAPLWESKNLYYRIHLINHLVEKAKSDKFEQFVTSTLNQY